MNLKKYWDEILYFGVRKLGTILHIPTPEQFWAFEIRDADGNLQHQHRERGHSWVRNAYNILTSQMGAVNSSDSTYGAGYLNIKDTGGTMRYGTMSATNGQSGSNIEAASKGYCGSAAESTKGIVVGTGGATAWTFEQVALTTKIAEGTGSGQLSHQAFSTPARSYNSETKVYSINHVRAFVNSSGAAITISEVGIYSQVWTTNTYVGMVTRDVLAEAVTIPNGSTLTVTYTVAVTYPA